MAGPYDSHCHGANSERKLGLGRTVIRRRRMYVHTYGICHMIQKPLSVCFSAGAYKETF
jgi:hypothetical protein